MPAGYSNNAFYSDGLCRRRRSAPRIRRLRRQHVQEVVEKRALRNPSSIPYRQRWPPEKSGTQRSGLELPGAAGIALT